MELARTMRKSLDNDRIKLDVVRRYWKGRQRLPAVIPSAAPREVRTLARIARVNICPIVVDSLAQATFVEGFRAERESDNAEAWAVWQKNKMDARQSGIHRAAFSYGTSYAVVLPGEGDATPTVRGVSPRSLVAWYGDDPDWPEFALERRHVAGKYRLWRLYDNEAIYYLRGTTRGKMEFIDSERHNAAVTPVVRYIDEEDLDCEDEPAVGFADYSWVDTPTRGQISPLMAIQDQIDLTTFGLLTAQWYSAFRQRYVIGWLASEEDRMKAGASQLWTFEDTADGEGGVKVGEFGQTDLGGYIESREASMRHAAALSQTPVHELIGELINLSAEALAAAEAGHERKVNERKTLLGESHEQTLRLAGRLGGFDVPDDAQVVWRDTSARTFAATVDGLGKLVQMLGIPPQELWERVPGATQQDVARWKAAAENGDAYAFLADIINRQSGRTTPPDAGAEEGA